MRLVGLFARFGVATISAATAVLLAAPPAIANVPVTPVSSDPYTDAQAQHQTQVQPDTFQFGSTIVSAFQSGRVFGGGASNIGWATSTDGGSTWTRGFLPGLTANSSPRGSYGQVSGPAVAFDARHNVWMITSIGITSSTGDILASRSTNGGLTWSNPVRVAFGEFLDKPWITCDNNAASEFYGNCYATYDIVAGNVVRMKTSTDGGLTWGPGRSPADAGVGIGGQPVVLNSGAVVVPYYDLVLDQIRSFRSVDGGASWRATVGVDTVQHDNPSGGLREFPFPSADRDGPGTIYLAWADCGFRAGCATNDIVLAKSTSETTWGPTVRVPIDPVTSGVDHFAPGIAVDQTSGGAAARIGVTYYYYANGSCTAATCQLNVGFISSTDGGSTWSAPTQIAGPMSLSWLPNTSQGRMFGDYISTSIVPGGNAFPVLPVAGAPSGGSFRLPMTVPTGGLELTGGTVAATARTSSAPATATKAAGAAPSLRFH
ncbi:MAG TPA: sialidase family protein [Actinophytocola sp.]|uniref:sialidase family protein n=1 Tax=Actinophytocola sp. TaxID=1872138 RepID=UPI002DBC3D95|nr:sialidase family protein [Actinophytocola sp.]HEU5470520.1 sialidase family protein [Actinophytocola sp.]